MAKRSLNDIHDVICGEDSPPLAKIASMQISPAGRGTRQHMKKILCNGSPSEQCVRTPHC